MQMETLWKLFPGGSNGRVFFQPAWRRSPGEEKWIPTPVLPREFHGQRIPWGHKELDTTNTFTFPFIYVIILLMTFRVCQHAECSGFISSFFPGSILGTYQPGEFIFQCHIFLSFHTVQLNIKCQLNC